MMAGCPQGPAGRREGDDPGPRCTVHETVPSAHGQDRKGRRLRRSTGNRRPGDLFEGCRQLIVQHFLFDPAWDEGCPSCTAACDENSPGLLRHLRSRDTNVAVVSRAPLDKISRYKSEKGWTFPWYSSFGRDVNDDFHVTIDGSVAPVMWNDRTLEELVELGMGWLGDGSSEPPGFSVFLRDGDSIFHTYSVFARGTEVGPTPSST
jgi:predicted dithiol-disulfide oxidoreductase (DUF899 family)